MRVGVVIFRSLIPLALLYMGVVLYQARMNPAVMSTDPKASDADKTYRQQMRGTISSLAASVVSMAGGVALLAQGASPSLVNVNYNTVFANVIGYMADKTITTDEALASTRRGVGSWLSYIGRSMATADFLRYTVSLMLDLMISQPVIEALRVVLLGTVTALAAGNGYDRFLAANADSLITALVATVLFNAYSNQVKVGWAYPDATYPASQRLMGNQVFLTVAVAGAMFLGYSLPGQASLGERLGYVLGTFAIVSLLFMRGEDNKQAAEYDAPEGSAVPGWLIFAAFAVYGIVVPTLFK